MKIRILIQILLLITGALSVLSTVIQSSELELYTKPITVPLFFMLYWFNSKKLDPLFILVLLLCFLGDIFLLVEIEKSFMYVLVCYSLCYFVMMYYMYNDRKAWVFSTLDWFNILIFFLFWSYIVYEVYNTVIVSMGELAMYGIFYLAVLYVLLTGVVFRYINSRSTQSFWFLLAIIHFVISDVSFAIDRFYVAALELKTINSIYQLLAVYFLVRFKLANDTALKLE